MNIPEDLLRYIFTFIPYCKHNFNIYPAFVSKKWLTNFRQSNSKCNIYYFFLDSYQYKYCYTHQPEVLDKIKNKFTY